MSIRVRVLIAAALAAVVTLVSGCNTMAGLGKDIQVGGEKTQELANNAKQKL